MKLPMYLFIFITMILTYEIGVCREVCVDIDSEPKLERNKKLTNNIIDIVQPVGFIMCAKQCYYHTDCLSWNFHKPSLRCEISYSSLLRRPMEVLLEENWYYGEKDDWSYLVTDICSNHLCPPLSRCYERHDSLPGCVNIGCGPPPHHEGLTYEPSGYYSFGTNVSYTVEYTKITVQSTCLVNSTWSDIPETDKCPDPQAPKNMQISIPSGSSVGSVILYECSDGFWTTGSLLSHCTSIGVWTGVEATCAPNWCMGSFKYYPDPVICYYWYKTEINNANAVKFCQLRSGHLLTIDSDERQLAAIEIVTSLMNTGQIGTHDKIWLDATRIAEQTVISSKPTRFDGYTKYIEDFSEKGNCLVIGPSNLPQMLWRFEDCNKSAYILCEKESPG